MDDSVSGMMVWDPLHESAAAAVAFVEVVVFIWQVLFLPVSSSTWRSNHRVLQVGGQNQKQRHTSMAHRQPPPLLPHFDLSGRSWWAKCSRVSFLSGNGSFLKPPRESCTRISLAVGAVTLFFCLTKVLFSWIALNLLNFERLERRYPYKSLLFTHCW